MEIDAQNGAPDNILDPSGSRCQAQFCHTANLSPESAVRSSRIG